MAKQFAAGLLVLLALPSVAEQGGKGMPENDAQFTRNKTVKLTGYREKIRILQESMTCVEFAQSWEAAKACDERERAAMEQHAKSMKQQWESLKK